MSRQRPHDRLLELLVEQCDFLLASAARFDSDARREAESGRQVLYPRGWPRGFVGLRLTTNGGASYHPVLDTDPEMLRGRLAFEEWWKKRLLDSPDNQEHWRRQDFVLGAANEEGAHVDPSPESWWD
jgi:hypothetical protein